MWGHTTQYIRHLLDEIAWLNERNAELLDRVLVQASPEIDRRYGALPSHAVPADTLPAQVRAAIDNRAEGDASLARMLAGYADVLLASQTSPDDVADAILQGSSLPNI